jgi:glucokinase
VTRYIGLDLGGTNIKGAAISLDEGTTEVMTTTSAPSHADGGPEAVTDALVEVGRSLLAEVDGAAGVGVGVPGLFDFASGEIVFFTNLPGPWEGYPLRARIAEALDLPTTLINDARAFTLAEATVGAAAGCRNVACLTLGTGVGGGLFLNGQLHFGAFGIGGEIGHQTLAMDGPLCGCGNPGCMEALTRPPAIAARAGLDRFEDVIEAADAGNPDAIAALDDAIAHLGVGLANIVTVLGPERIVIGGGAAGEALVERIQEAVRTRVTLVPRDRILVVPATLGATGGAVGAAIAAVDSPSRDRTFLAGEIPSAAMRRDGLRPTD